MESKASKNPYDSFFRRAFGDPEAARELALNLVPSSYERFVSGARVSVEQESCVDETLRVQQSDVLIRLRRRGQTEGADDVLVYILVEHKSNPDRWVAMQMLRYLLGVWDRERRTARDVLVLPKVLPVVVYHGVHSWRHTREFADLVSGSGIGDRHVPRFSPLFVNLADLPDALVVGSVRTITALLFLKYVKRRIADSGARILDILHRANADPDARALVATCYRTLVMVKERDEIEALQTLAATRRYHLEREDVMTYGEELLAEGMERGMQKGALVERQAVLVRLLERRFRLLESERARIEACTDAEALDAALDEFVVAETKASVLARLP